MTNQVAPSCTPKLHATQRLSSGDATTAGEAQPQGPAAPGERPGFERHFASRVCGDSFRGEGTRRTKSPSARAAVAVLNVGGTHDRVHQEALRIDKDVPFLALDLRASLVSAPVSRSSRAS